MKILLTGANGYIGKRLLPILIHHGHEVVCCVRDKNRISLEASLQSNVTIAEVDFLKRSTLEALPKDIDIAYYLIHSMSSSTTSFMDMESQSARNFIDYLENTTAQQQIYLTGLINPNAKLSPHLESRFNVEEILKTAKTPYTFLRAGIIVGSGSASFEIIRDLVEKLPVMITPKWVNTRSQPIAVRNVLDYLTKVMAFQKAYNQVFDIGGPEVLTYKSMMLQYAEVRKLNRYIGTLPIMTPRLSSYWLYFVTSTSYKLAVNLVNSMKVDVICRDNQLEKLLQIKPIPYMEAIARAFSHIEQNSIVSSWKDAYNTTHESMNITDFIAVPRHGVFTDQKMVPLPRAETQVLRNIWSLGGQKGWYYANKLWALRGFIDKLFGGVGLRRGRTNPEEIHPGDALDFWRVIIADKESMRLLLYAEMKLPGEAWLEFQIKNHQLIQTATFRPRGLWGRMYWYLVSPFHWFIFKNMAKNIALK